MPFNFNKLRSFDLGCSKSFELIEMIISPNELITIQYGCVVFEISRWSILGAGSYWDTLYIHFIHTQTIPNTLI